MRVIDADSKMTQLPETEFLQANAKTNERLGDAVNRAIQVARDFKRPAQITFNNIPVRVHGESIPTMVIKDFDAAYAARMQSFEDQRAIPAGSGNENISDKSAPKRNPDIT